MRIKWNNIHLYTQKGTRKNDSVSRVDKRVKWKKREESEVKSTVTTDRKVMIDKKDDEIMEQQTIIHWFLIFSWLMTLFCW